MNRVPIPWPGRALVIRDIRNGCHPESAEPQGWRVEGAAERGEGPRAFLTAWFTENELSTVGSFDREKRRNEWILSRIAAKQLAIDRGLCSDPRSCAIENRRIGSWYVSLSHSGPYAGAAIDEKPIGLDVQVVRELNERAAHLFLSESEMESMHSCRLPYRLLHFFCAKEAGWKREEGAIETLKRVPLRLSAERANGLLFDDVETVAIGDVIVALAR